MASDPVRANYLAADVRVLQVEPQLPAAALGGNYFFRVLVQ